MSDDQEYEGIDGTKVKNVVLIAMVIGLVLVGGFLLVDHFSLQPYRKMCEENPRLRYAQACTDMEDCITKCARKQAREGTS